MRFCGLPDEGTDGGENYVLRTNWDANCMAGTDGGENCVLGTNWDADCMMGITTVSLELVLEILAVLMLGSPSMT